MSVKLRFILLLSILLIGQFRASFQGQASFDLLFVRDAPGRQRIILSSSDGQETIDLTGDQFDSDAPVWSPDGREIMFIERVNGSQYLMLINADGTDKRPLAPTEYDSVDDPAWSPDGRRIVFTHESDGDTDIYLLDRDDNTIMRLTETPGFDGQPAWSPDGSRIAFVSERDGNREVYIMNADGSDDPRRITRSDENEETPMWRPEPAVSDQVVADYVVLSCGTSDEDAVRVWSPARFSSAWRTVDNASCLTDGVGIILAELSEAEIVAALPEATGDDAPDIILVTTDTLEMILDFPPAPPDSPWILPLQTPVYWMPTVPADYLANFTVNGQLLAIPVDETHGFAVASQGENHGLAEMILARHVAHPDWQPRFAGSDE